MVSEAFSKHEPDGRGRGRCTGYAAFPRALAEDLVEHSLRALNKEVKRRPRGRIFPTRRPSSGRGSVLSEQHDDGSSETHSAQALWRSWSEGGIAEQTQLVAGKNVNTRKAIYTLDRHIPAFLLEGKLLNKR